MKLEVSDDVMQTLGCVLGAIVIVFLVGSSCIGYNALDFHMKNLDKVEKKK